MLTFLLATRNRHKVRELRRILKGLPIRFFTADQFPDLPAVREDGATFRANAAQKAVAASRRTILPVLAEDSGLEVAVLKGKPGVHSARYALRQAPSGPSARKGQRQDERIPIDQANVKKLLREMDKIPASRRQARFVCVMALAAGGNLVKTFEGSVAGSIAFEAAGRTGFGYDPIFIPRGHRKTMSQLGARTKDGLSHRAKAAAKLERWIMTAD